MIEVFKTNVQNGNQASAVLKTLSGFAPQAKINFDLEDCDKILRVEAENISSHLVINLMNKMNYLCEVLPD